MASVDYMAGPVLSSDQENTNCHRPPAMRVETHDGKASNQVTFA